MTAFVAFIVVTKQWLLVPFVPLMVYAALRLSKKEGFKRDLS